MDERVGFIGLGLMGRPMALNLLKAGFELTVHSRSPGPVEELAAAGAAVTRSPREVAEASTAIITCLPDSPDVEAAVFGPAGVAEGAAPGSLFIDHSTIRPEAARRIAAGLAQRAVGALDAPVSGGDVGARAGTLAIMVGGEPGDFERARPIFEAVGKTVTYVGRAGAGQVAKACNQIMVAAQMVAMAELLLFAQKAGVAPGKVIDAIKGGAAQCWTLDVKPPRLFAGERRPGFKARMMHKDLAIVADTAQAYGMPLPMTSINLQLFEEMLRMGLGELDNSAVIGVLEAKSGERLEPSPAKP
jgi:2-hydroxy-3-oxopropionate reductase